MSGFGWSVFIGFSSSKNFTFKCEWPQYSFERIYEKCLFHTHTLREEEPVHGKHCMWLFIHSTANERWCSSVARIFFQANLTLFHTLNALGYKCHTSRNVPWHLISDAATAVPFHNVQIRLYHDMNSTFFFVSITLLPFRKKSNVACI